MDAQNDKRPVLAADKRDPEHAAYRGPVTAIAVGYYGNKRRDYGEVFNVKAGGFSPNWMVKGGKTLPAAPADPNALNGDGTSKRAPEADDVVVIPEDWKSMHHKKRMALAYEISGVTPEDSKAADAVIEAEVANRDLAAKKDLHNV